MPGIPHRHVAGALLAACLAVATLAAQNGGPRIALTDITREAGITARHDNGAAGGKLLPETMGAGAAFFDYDNDGDQDLVVTVNNGPARVLRNDSAGGRALRLSLVGVKSNRSAIGAEVRATIGCLVL